MNVLAVSTPHSPDWRWRIVDYVGATVAESPGGFASIAEAVAAGAVHLERLSQQDRAQVARHPWH
ncbi:MAG TPA: hypothetical protein VGM22_24990 [Methylomirabilota bacterium]